MKAADHWKRGTGQEARELSPPEGIKCSGHGSAERD